MGARLCSFLLLSLGVTACTSVVDDFDGYVARPTMCDLLDPQGADPRAHLRCAGSETCVMANADGSPSTTQTACFPSRALEERSACEFANDCAAGEFCAGSAGCLRWCPVGDGTCADGRPCMPFADKTTLDGQELGYCGLPECNPLTSNCDGACWFDTPNHAGCFPHAGAGAAGTTCTTDNDCRAGLACGSEGVCTRYCRDGFDDCDGERCLFVDGEELVLDGVRHGYCARGER
jgi:hypothetical protein